MGYGNENIDIESEFILDDFPYLPHFIVIDQHMISYIDEGKDTATPILLLHGVPSWSYLFRKIIPELLLNGHRVIAPDLLGFGRSEHPKSKSIYSYEYLCSLLTQFIKKLNLNHILLFGHDWGGILGLGLATDNKARFSALIMSNGFLPRGDEKVPIIFFLWKLFTRVSPILPVGKMISWGCKTKLKKSEKRAYDLPFHATKNKLAIKLLPQLLPFKDNSDKKKAQQVWRELEQWEKPLLTLFSEQDPFSYGGGEILEKHIPGAKGQEHIRIKGKHFSPEDAPQEITTAILRLIKTL